MEERIVNDDGLTTHKGCDMRHNRGKRSTVDSKLQLILGGARTGKSRFSLDQGNELSFERRFFVATATTHDEEMKDRVLHALASLAANLGP